jgi:hypothetical protein
MVRRQVVSVAGVSYMGESSDVAVATMSPVSVRERLEGS